MQEIHAKAKSNSAFDIYDYIVRLEDEVKALRAECDMNEARAAELERQLERLYSKARCSCGMPKFAGAIKELRSSRSA